MPKFRVSLFSLALMLAVPFAPQAVAKTAAATTASQPEIASGSAMIVDLNTNKVIYSNHPDLVRPIASISKLMTAMVVLDARLPLDEKLKVDISQTPEMKAAMGSVAGKETPLSLPGISSLCHILCVIYSQACIELVDKITV